MEPFMGTDFLLAGPAAKTLYHSYAKDMPIVDYHCHVSPQEIYEDRRFANLYEAWLAADHYKWRLMRFGGVEERYITGDALAREKFQEFAEVLPRAVGNPLYHWCHMELKTFFGYEGVLNGNTAEEVWALCNGMLARPDMSVRGLIAKSKVVFIGTTDDPADSLEWHAKLMADPTMQTRVAPSFRPDKALNIEKPGWREYLQVLGGAAGVPIASVKDLQAALLRRMEHFDAHGCRASDHGLDTLPFMQARPADLEAIFQKVFTEKAVPTPAEAETFKTELLLFCARQYARLGWVLQLHFNCLRNPNTGMLEALGPDTGFDSMNHAGGVQAAAKLLDTLYGENALPRTILYSLNPDDNGPLAVIAGAFQGGGIPGRVQHGSAWWFNDTKTGMETQLENLANVGVLGSFVGMLTDSRSFLSYTRHEYFRRILCNFVGGLVDRGEYPDDQPRLGGLVQDICCRNALHFFQIEEGVR